VTHLKGKRERSGGDCRDERGCRVQELNKRRCVRDTVADEDGKKTGKDVGQGQIGGRKEMEGLNSGQTTCGREEKNATSRDLLGLRQVVKK
jgi:hypothetical protein